MSQHSAIVIGAGIAGLATARALAVRGYMVKVIERNERAIGASIRNFGMILPVGQPDGKYFNRAMASRGIWKQVCTDAKIGYDEAGSLQLAYADDEWEVLQELSKIYKHRGYTILKPDETIKKSPAVIEENLKGSLYSKDEIIVDPRQAIAGITAWLSEKYNVQFVWGKAATDVCYPTVYSGKEAFEADENKKLKRIGEEVLVFVKRHQCYHFLIDRFGQVFRIVQESDIANHSGNSVWADDRVIYVNLNASFFGIAFETQTQKGQDLPSGTAAQIHSARVLTQMLRGKYRIPASNCVTHAQVSVNPSNMLVGYHTDWSGNFPFLELGLNDNYTAPPAAIVAFGFDYDPTFVHATGARIWQGLGLAEDQIRSQAAAQGLPVPEYRSILQKKYKEIIATLKASGAKETSHAT